MRSRRNTSGTPGRQFIIGIYYSGRFRMKKTRPYKAGKQIAEALCETANILYLLDNREQYLQGIKDRIDGEVNLVQLVRWQSDENKKKTA